MQQFALLPESERIQAFELSLADTGMPAFILEKDFWVCWTLAYLFGKSPHKAGFSFKGGTSLSKGFNLINRFSEDIDLILDWRMLAYTVDEPWEKRSNTKQDAFIEEANSRAAAFVAEELVPQMQADFATMINGEFKLYPDGNDPQTLCFDYPRSFDGSGILQQIRLETGALAAWTPAHLIPIKPYLADALPELINKPTAQVLTVDPERTFWEKITVLHREAFRTNGNVPPRYSRHYYDIYKLCNSPVKSSAFKELDLLDKVVEFKMCFYRSNAARYDLAKPGTMRLMPPAESKEKIRQDYRQMQPMLFGDIPDFSTIMSTIENLEAEINGL